MNGSSMFVNSGQNGKNNSRGMQLNKKLGVFPIPYTLP